MLDQVLHAFQIKPDFDLNIMKERQTLAEITSNALVKLDGLFKEIKPDIVLVHGDTTTTFAGSLATFYHQIAVGHVEAGLRTGNKYSPFPEELNRQMTGALADIHFAPTQQAKQNLLNENKKKAPFLLLEIQRLMLCIQRFTLNIPITLLRKSAMTE